MWSPYSPILEVHSILVRFRDSDSTRYEVYGKAIAEHGTHTFNLFNEDKENSKCGTILPDGTLSMTGPDRCMVGLGHTLLVILRDKETGVEISTGYYDKGFISHDFWFDRPLRVLIPGDQGFTVFHYSLFENGVQTSLRVKFLPKKRKTNPENTDDQRCEKRLVYGTVYARNSKYDTEYPGELSKKYYRSTLFCTSSANPMRLNESGHLQLSRSVVGIPDMSNLIIEAKLWDTCDDVSEPRSSGVEGSVSIFLDHSKERKSTTTKIEGTNYCIQIEVEWSHAA